MPTNTVWRSRNVSSVGEWLVSGVGFVLSTVGVLYVVVHPDPLQQWWVELVAALAVPAVLMYGGYWLATNEFDPGEVYTVAQGWFAGVVGLSVVGGWAILSTQTAGPVVIESLFLLATIATAGSVLGLAFGIQTTRLTAELAVFDDVVDQRADEADRVARSAIDDVDVSNLSPERRRIYRTIVERDAGTITVDELASSFDDGATSHDRTIVTLHHVHLPKLDEENLIEYDPRQRIVDTSNRRENGSSGS